MADGRGPDDVDLAPPTDAEIAFAASPDAVLGQVAVPEPVAPEPLRPSPAQWAWGADYSADKADEAQRAHEREQLEQGLEKSRTGFGARLRGAFGRGSRRTGTRSRRR